MKSFLSKNFLSNKRFLSTILFLLGITIFTTEFARCASDALAECNDSATLKLQDKFGALDLGVGNSSKCNMPKLSTDSHEPKEEIGTVTQETIVESKIPTSPKYENFEWWLSALEKIQKIARNQKGCTYTDIVTRGMEENGYSLKNSLDNSIENATSQFFGDHSDIDDFHASFDKKLCEFKKFSIDYLARKAMDVSKASAESSNSESNILSANDFDIPQFLCFIQKGKLPINENFSVFQIGDLHGDLVALLTILKYLEHSFNTDFSLKNKNSYLVFTGDYIDRGFFGLEILFILMSLKIKNPDNVFLLLGNHEASHKFLLYYNMGFAREVAQKFNFGSIKFEEETIHDTLGKKITNKYITGPGVQACQDFMQKLEDYMFKYLPTALFMKVKNENILFCHGLPDINFQEAISYFLQDDLQSIGLSDRHPETTAFTDKYIYIPEAPQQETPQQEAPQQGNTDLSRFQLLESIGEFMDENCICLCMRGHQHNVTLNVPFIFHGGVALSQASKHSCIITTSSFDINCSPEAKVAGIGPEAKVAGIGDYAHFCMLSNKNSTIKLQAMSIDRNNGSGVILDDRDKINLKMRLEKQEDQEDKDPIDPATMRQEIEATNIHLIPEFSSLSPSNLPQDESDTNVLRKIYYFAIQTENLHRIDLDGIKDYLVWLGIILPDGSLSVESLPIDSSKMLALWEILSDPELGVFALIKDIRKNRTTIAELILGTHTAKEIKPQILKSLDEIYQDDNLLADKLKDIGDLLNEPNDCVKKKIATLLGDDPDGTI